MARILLIALLLVLTVSDADARRRHHRHWHRAPVMMIGAGCRAMDMPREMRGLDMPREMRRSSGFIPADWQLQPDDPNFSGRRYMAPDGSAWLALYSAPADKVNVAVHLKNVAFADGEEVTYLRGARDWLAVSGLKGDRVYYRKAALVLRRHAVAPHRVRVSGGSEAAARPRRGARRAGVRPARRGSCSGDLFTAPAAGFRNAGRAEAGRSKADQTELSYSAWAPPWYRAGPALELMPTKPFAFISSMKLRR